MYIFKNVKNFQLFWIYANTCMYVCTRVQIMYNFFRFLFSILSQFNKLCLIFFKLFFLFSFVVCLFFLSFFTVSLWFAVLACLVLSGLIFCFCYTVLLCFDLICFCFYFFLFGYFCFLFYFLYLLKYTKWLLLLLWLSATLAVRFSISYASCFVGVVVVFIVMKIF